MHAIDVISNESGADHREVQRDTALGASYVSGNLTMDGRRPTSPRRMRSPVRDRSGDAVCRRERPRDGGTGGSRATTPILGRQQRWAITGPPCTRRVINFAGLADQYLATVGGHYSGPGVRNLPGPHHRSERRQMGALDRLRPTGRRRDRHLCGRRRRVGGMSASTGRSELADGKARPIPSTRSAERHSFSSSMSWSIRSTTSSLTRPELEDTDEFWVDTIDPSVFSVDWTSTARLRQAGEQSR